MDKQPTKIKVGPYDYSIRWYLREEENKDERYGYTDNNELEIGISDRLPPSKKADTFIHEALHALWYVLDLKPKSDEEKTVLLIAMGLTMLARDNPEVFAWWFALTHPEKSNKIKK